MDARSRLAKIQIAHFDLRRAARGVFTAMENDVSIGKAKVKKITIGIDSDYAAAAIEAAKSGVKNKVEIDELEGDDAVIGIRIDSVKQLQTQLEACRDEIQTTLGDDAPAAATAALQEATSELKKDKPEGKSVLEKIEMATNALKNLGEVAEKAAKVAPLVALLKAVYAGAKAWFGFP
jgi:hypothetical protein